MMLIQEKYELPNLGLHLTKLEDWIDMYSDFFVQIIIQHDNQSNSTCCGVIVARRDVLSAAHCFSHSGFSCQTFRSFANFSSFVTAIWSSRMKLFVSLTLLLCKIIDEFSFSEIKFFCQFLRTLIV